MTSTKSPSPWAGAAIPDYVVDACRTLRRAGHQAWVVGGAVRDMCLGRPVKDWDIATSAPPDAVKRAFGASFTIPTGEKHGTVTVLVRRPDGQREPIEVTTFRGDGAYTDGRRPDEIRFVETIEEDLSRRDFTVNAIAYDPLDDRLADPFDGQGDLTRKLLRAVGVADERFAEDGLRAMRAVRFSSQLGFALDPATHTAITNQRHVFAKVAVERIHDELVKILDSPRPGHGIRLCHDTRLLGIFLPELEEGVGLHQNRYHAFDVWGHNLASLDAAEHHSVLGPSWLVRLAALLHDVGKPRTAAPHPDAPTDHTFYNHEILGAEMADTLLRRLRFANDEREHLCALIRHHMWCYTPDWTDGAVRRFMARVGPKLLPDLFALRRADIMGKGHGEDPDVELVEIRQRVHTEEQRQSALSVGDLAVTGKDLMAALAVPPGPVIGRVLRGLLERVLEDASLNQRESLLALAQQLATEDSKGN